MPPPKDPTRLRRAKSGPLKMECFACPQDGRPIVYASRGNVAANGAPRCGRCGGPFMFSDVTACADIQPDLLDSHPVAQDERVRELRAAERDARDHPHPDLVCTSCEATAPRGSRPESWYCGACQWHNTTAGDGSRVGQTLKRGTGAWEDAHERDTRRDRPADLPTLNYPRNRIVRIMPARRPETGPIPTTYQETSRDDIPF